MVTWRHFVMVTRQKASPPSSYIFMKQQIPSRSRHESAATLLPLVNCSIDPTPWLSSRPAGRTINLPKGWLLIFSAFERPYLSFSIICNPPTLTSALRRAVCRGLPRTWRDSLIRTHEDTNIHTHTLCTPSLWTYLLSLQLHPTLPHSSFMQ